MKPKTPPQESIRVLGMKYDVLTGVPGIMEEDFCGSVDFYAKTIRIRLGLDESHRASTLLHEIIEIANNDLQLKLKHPQIMALEKVLYSSLVENPLLLGMLNTVALEEK